MDAQARRVLAQAKRDETEALFEELKRNLEKIRDKCPGSYDRVEHLVNEMDPHLNDAGHANKTRKKAVPKQKAVPQKSLRASPFTQVATADTSASVKDNSTTVQPNQSKKRASQTTIRSFMADSVEAKRIKSGQSEEPAQIVAATQTVSTEVECDVDDPNGYCKLRICQSWRLKQGICSHQHFKLILCEKALSPVKKGNGTVRSGKGFPQTELEDDDDDDELPYIIKPETQHW